MLRSGSSFIKFNDLHYLLFTLHVTRCSAWKCKMNKICKDAPCLCYLLTYSLTPHSTVLLEKLTGLQLVKKFPAFYVTRMFITALSSARRLSLSWASSIQSMPTNSTTWRSILILHSHLRLVLPSGHFPSGFPHQNPVYTPHSSTRATCTAHLILLDFITRTMLGEEYRSWSSSLRSFLHSPVTSSLVAPNILPNTPFLKHPQPTFLPQCERPSFTPIVICHYSTRVFQNRSRWLCHKSAKFN
jgi:hypothetical protein